MPELKLWRIRLLKDGKEYAATVSANTAAEAREIVKRALKAGKLVVKNADEIKVRDSGYKVSRSLPGIEH